MVREFWWRNKVPWDYLFTVTIHVRTTLRDLSGFGNTALKGCSSWSPRRNPLALFCDTVLPWLSLCVRRRGGIHSTKHLGMSLPPSIVESTFRNQGKLTTCLNQARKKSEVFFGLLWVSENQWNFKKPDHIEHFFSPSYLFHLGLLEDFFYWKIQG